MENPALKESVVTVVLSDGQTHLTLDLARHDEKLAQLPFFARLFEKIRRLKRRETLPRPAGHDDAGVLIHRQGSEILQDFIRRNDRDVEIRKKPPHVERRLLAEPEIVFDGDDVQ